jgi:hypothetical protein
MRRPIAVGAVVFAALLACNAEGAGALKSGPQPGDFLTPFEPLHVNGPDKGTKRCLV